MRTDKQTKISIRYTLGWNKNATTLRYIKYSSFYCYNVSVSDVCVDSYHERGLPTTAQILQLMHFLALPSPSPNLILMQLLALALTLSLTLALVPVLYLTLTLALHLALSLALSLCLILSVVNHLVTTATYQHAMHPLQRPSPCPFFLYFLQPSLQLWLQLYLYLWLLPWLQWEIPVHPSFAELPRG